MKVRMENGLERQAYASPRTESIELINEGLLCASVMGIDGFVNEGFDDDGVGTWTNL